MKKLQIALVSMLFVALTAFTTAEIWKNDPAHSEVEFTVGHLGISEVTGTFNDFTAVVNSSKADFSDAVVEATIHTASIDTRVEMRNNHLKSADFFDAAKYPDITFKSTSIKSAGKGKFKLVGNLTIKDVTKPVTLDMVYNGTIENPMSKKPTAGFKLTGTIKRTDFNFGTKFPAPMVSDEVKININAELNK